MRRRRGPADLILASVVLSLLLAGCQADANERPELAGPGGSGIVVAEPSGPGPDTVTEQTACDLAAGSATLEDLGGIGTVVNPDFVVELSICQVALGSPDYPGAMLTVGVLTAADVALTADADPALSGSTLVALPELGTDGHFIGRGPGVDPAANPTAGAVLASNGELGVSVTWSMTPPLPFASFEQIVRELLAQLG